MSLTKGRIERAGKVVFHDASLAVWEEADDLIAARNADGYKGEQRWERQFKRDVFARIVQTLNRLGWTIGPQTYIFTGNNSRYCRKGDLQADLILSGRHIEFKMFQDVNAPDRPDHGGRYQYNQEQHMPYLMRLEMERTRRRIRDYLCNVFTGYEFEPPKEPKRGPNGVTALEWIEAHYKASWHYEPELGRPDGDECSYNNGSAEKGVVRHGERVWFADRKGRIVTGIAYYNINNMWWVVTGKYDLHNQASFDLFTKQPENLRIKRNASIRRKRLERELAQAVEKMDFERAAVLRDIAFPGNRELFNVWHDEHKAYHSPGFCGYTTDRIKAGKFTADEVRNWNHVPNRIVPIAETEQQAA